MNKRNFCRKWVIFEEGMVPGPKVIPGGGEFEITQEADGRLHFGPLSAGLGLPAAYLTETTGEGEFEHGTKLAGGLKGSFRGVGSLLFTLNKLGGRRFVISITVLAAAAAKRRATKSRAKSGQASAHAESHGGPHGVDG